MTKQLALQPIIDQLPSTSPRVVGEDTGMRCEVLDPRDIPLNSDLIDVWAAATSLWMMRYTNRGKRGKSPETIKVHARAWFDFFSYQLPVRPVLAGLEAQARAIAAGDETAMLHLSRQIREVITECYVQSRIAQYAGRKSTVRAPWEIDTLDMQRWELDLEQRTYTTTKLQRGPRKSKRNPLGGNRRLDVTNKLSPESISQRLAALSSYYIYVSEKHIITHADGGIRPLHNLNPVRPLPRHEVFQYGKAVAMDAEQVTQLLRTIRSNHSVTGLRDFALFSAYLYLGRRNSEVRELLWGDILNDGKQYQTRTKGKKDHYEKADLPRPVYAAIVRYLQASDRLDTIQPSDPIFIAHSDRARHLKTRAGQPVVGEHYAPGAACLSSREVGRVLKKYARRAGLNEDDVHVHVLRHSAAMLRKAVGDPLEDISKMLGHANFNTTRIYLDHMEGHKDVSWRKVEALIGLPEDD